VLGDGGRGMAMVVRHRQRFDGACVSYKSGKEARILRYVCLHILVAVDRWLHVFCNVVMQRTIAGSISSKSCSSIRRRRSIPCLPKGVMLLSITMAIFHHFLSYLPPNTCLQAPIPAPPIEIKNPPKKIAIPSLRPYPIYIFDFGGQHAPSLPTVASWLGW
jgi:hypothetical protein